MRPWRQRLFKRSLPYAALCFVVFSIYAFMFAPIVVVLLASINSSQYFQFPPSGLSLRWYRAVFTPEWMGPASFSFVLATVSAALATLLGSLGAFAVVRYRFRGREALAALLESPIGVPSIVLGVALLQFFSIAGAKSLIGFPALLLAHTVETVPFVTRTAYVSLVGIDRSLELAAMNLGARPWQTLRSVTLPLIKPGLFAGGAFAFVVSFNNVNLSLFLVRPGQITLPIRIMNFLEFGTAPVLAAVNILSLSVIILVFATAERVGGFTQFIYGR